MSIDILIIDVSHPISLRCGFNNHIDSHILFNPTDELHEEKVLFVIICRIKATSKYKRERIKQSDKGFSFEGTGDGGWGSYIYIEDSILTGVRKGYIYE